MNNFEQDEVVVIVQFIIRILEEVSMLGFNYGVIIRVNLQNKLKWYMNVFYIEMSLDEF